MTIFAVKRKITQSNRNSQSGQAAIFPLFFGLLFLLAIGLGVVEGMNSYMPLKVTVTNEGAYPPSEISSGNIQSSTSSPTGTGSQAPIKANPNPNPKPDTNTDNGTSISKPPSSSAPQSVPIFTPTPPIITPPPLTTPPVTPPPVSTPTPRPSPITSSAGDNVGIAVGENLSNLSQSDLNRVLDDIASLGVRWIRFDVSWSSIQPNNASQYDWSKIDRIVSSANARGLKLLPILTYTPRWARWSECADSSQCSPKDPAQFGVFAAAAARRYSSQGVHVWEIWNEENLRKFYLPEANPADYRELLKSAYTNIKAQDPTATVMLGGLAAANNSNGSISSIDFLTAIYDQDGKAYFDAVADHPYSFPIPPSYQVSWNAWQQINNTNPSLRSIMDSNGDGAKAIWITEYGAPTNGPGSTATPDNYAINKSANHVDEALQAQILQDAISSAKAFSWTSPVFWYSYKDLDTDTSTNENFFGLIRADGSHKPAYDMLKSILTSN